MLIRLALGRSRMAATANTPIWAIMSVMSRPARICRIRYSISPAMQIVSIKSLGVEL